MDPCCVRSVLYCYHDYSGGHAKVHRWQNCRELNKHTVYTHKNDDKLYYENLNELGGLYQWQYRDCDFIL